MFTCNSGSETEILALLSLEISSELLSISTADGVGWGLQPVACD